MSAIRSMFNYMAAGNTVTTRQARTMFKVKHISTIAYRLRNAGVPVYTNRVTTSRGVKSFAYRIGTPSEAFLRNLGSRHVARARKTLYRQALAA